MTIFDRYLLRRYWHVFFIGFLSLFGLYFIIDLFTNVNDFLDRPGGMQGIFAYIAQHYAYRSCWFFGMVGGTLEVIAAMVALALMQKHGELNPVLAAGVSTFRLMQPLLIGAAFVNGLILMNQELVIPRIALQLQMNAGSEGDTTGEIDPVLDFATNMLIGGRRLNLREMKIEQAEFTLRPPISESLVTLTGKEAFPVPAKGRRGGGWLIKGALLTHDQLALTEAGRKIVKPGKGAEEIFVQTDVGFDRLYNRDKHYEFLSTMDLMRRIRNPSFNHRSVRSQSLYLHTRFTKPLMNLIVVLVGVPFVVRKESVSLLTNLGICCGVMGAMFAINEAFLYFGKVSLLSPELAVWAPIIVWGSAAAWLTGLVRT